MSTLRLASVVSLSIMAAFGVLAFTYDAAAQSCQPPNMLIVQDISATMGDDLGGITKWEVARNSVKTATDKYGQSSSTMRVRFGLELFANPDPYDHEHCFIWCWDDNHAHVDDSGGSCRVNKIHVDVGDNTAAAIQNKMFNDSNVTPWSDTPLDGALNYANSYASLRDGSRQNFVLLVTDGMETCDGDPVQAVKNLRASNIKTFVVGFGSGVDSDTLNSMATEGGTAKTGTTKYYQANNQSELVAALDVIASQVAAGDCTVPGKLGECAKGVKQCVSGQITCGQVNFPITESCDGKDHNCNGQIDDVSPQVCDFGCGAGTETCSGGNWVGCTAPHTISTTCSSTCGNGTKTCTNGTWSSCNAPQPNSCGTCSDIQDCDNGCGDIGTQTCSGGTWSACSATTSRQCDNGCGDVGTQTCSGGIWSACSAPTTKACLNSCGVPGTQSCIGGSWTSCDSPTVRECDNGCGDKGTQTCSNGNWGVCSAPTVRECDNGCGDKGSQICSGGSWGVCSAPTVRECDNGCGDKGSQTCSGNNWTACSAPSTRECTRQCGKGVETCSGGNWVNCTAQTANSCDTCSDTQECSTICGSGTATCFEGGWICDARKPTPETCNGFDDDCDGTPDNGDPGGGRICATGKPGECAMGITHCVGGEIICLAMHEPVPEICDGLDNDCDGVIDNGVRNPCGRCGQVPTEVCNNLDDDCDGTVDNGAICVDQSKVCKNGECVATCVNNECPIGYICKEFEGETFCVSPCNGVKCDPGYQCDPYSGKCFDPCDGVECKENEICLLGKCVSKDCHESGCPNGYICVNGSCVQDPCALVTCQSNEQCVNGNCIPSCATVSCPLWQHCEEGKCIGDPCDKVTCPEGQRCEDGNCVDDPCNLKECGKGYICVGDNCVDDPCLTVKCPDGQVCKNGGCFFEETVNDGGSLPDGSVANDGGSDNDGSVFDAGSKPDGSADGAISADGSVKDGGSGSDGSAETDGGGNRDGGGGASESGNDPASGCSCASVSVGESGSSILWLFAALGAVLLIMKLRRDR